MARAYRLLTVVTGSQRGDVPTELVTDRLDRHAAGCRVIEVPWSMLHGAATGVDTICRDWARAHGIEEAGIDAEWTRYGRQAGPIRNAQMAAAARRCLDLGWGVAGLAWPSKAESDTWDMVKRLREIPVAVDVITS